MGEHDMEEKIKNLKVCCIRQNCDDDTSGRDDKEQETYYDIFQNLGQILFVEQAEK